MNIKIKIVAMFLFCMPGLKASGQEIGRLKNAWKGTYLNIENGALSSTEIKDDWLSARWELMAIPGGQFYIKNVWKSTYLNIENGALQCSQVNLNSASAKWVITKIEGSDAVRISNAGNTALSINIESGSPVCTPIKDDWWSARWVWEPVSAGNNPTNYTMNVQEVLAAHNVQRSEVGVPPLTWSDELAAKAQRWATELAKKNMGNEFVLEHGSTGENIAGGFITGDSPETRVLKGWGSSEQVNFDRNTRKCKPNTICGHYTQIIWRNTTQVGCAIAVNPNGKYILVCNYNPPGNMNNQPAY